MGYVTDFCQINMTTRAASSSSSSSSTPSTSSSQRLLPRRWRSKGKNASSSSSSSSSQQPMWSPEGPCTWCCVSGRRVVLKPISILQLSEAERLALQKLASSKLQTMDLGCAIVVPKDNIGEWGRQRKRALSLKRKCKSANLGSLLDTLASDKGKDKDNKGGLAFGIPLSRVILHDRQRTKKRENTPAPPGHKRSGSADLLLTPSHDRKSSSSSQGSLENGAPNGSAAPGENVSESARRAASADSLSTWEESNESGSNSLIEALSLSAPGGDAGQSQLLGDGPQVPHVVSTCLQHLETHGLNVVGIFRVGSSKKRVKQLRDEFDAGHLVELTEEHNVHDVGALLKEFFRDLPEPLLTRDLFLPFVATRKIKDREKQAEAMRLLLTLLPVANRDTLWALLRFLLTVNSHSEDKVDDNGQEQSGNKMDSQNLATLFGPNVLHCLRAVGEKQVLADCVEQAEQSSEVIGVIRDLIDNHVELFDVSADQHDEILRLMMEVDRENLEMTLRRLSSDQQEDTDLDSTSEHPSTESLPHTSSSDADLLQLVRRKGPYQQHQPVRVTRSADPWTDGPRTSEDLTGPSLNSKDPAGEEDTASEPCTTTLRRRPMSSSALSAPRTTVIHGAQDVQGESRDSAPRRRTHGTASSSTRPLSRQGAVRERPYSDTTTGRLALPRPAYSRENSGTSSEGSSSGVNPTSPGDSSQQDLPPRQPPSPRPYPSGPASRQQRVATRLARRERDEGSEGDGPQWQRDRWRHWHQISTDRQCSVPDTEQETLV